MTLATQHGRRLLLGCLLFADLGLRLRDHLSTLSARIQLLNLLGSLGYELRLERQVGRFLLRLESTGCRELLTLAALEDDEAVEELTLVLHLARAHEVGRENVAASRLVILDWAIVTLALHKLIAQRARRLVALGAARYLRLVARGGCHRVRQIERIAHVLLADDSVAILHLSRGPAISTLIYATMRFRQE